MGWKPLALLTILALLPLAAYLAFRLIRYVMRNSLWSLRNRLLFVYGPLLILLGIDARVFFNQLDPLHRRCWDGIQRNPIDRRMRHF